MLIVPCLLRPQSLRPYTQTRSFVFGRPSQVLVDQMVTQGTTCSKTEGDTMPSKIRLSTPVRGNVMAQNAGAECLLT